MSFNEISFEHIIHIIHSFVNSIKTYFLRIPSWICGKKNSLSVTARVIKILQIGKRMDARTKSFRIFSFIVSGTFRSLLRSYEFQVRVSAVSARFCGKDEIAIGWGRILPSYMNDWIPRWMKGEGAIYGLTRCGNYSILVKGKSGSARSVYIIRAVLSFLATTSRQ